MLARRRHCSMTISRGGANSFVRGLGSKLVVRPLVRLFKMSPMAVTGSIFSHDEISVAGRTVEERNRERDGKRERCR